MFKILIVEDDNSNFILLKKVISSHFAVEIFRAENGLEALKMLEKTEVDGVILDISMPVMNGLEVLETIRSDEKIADLPVIMLSAINSREEVEIAMKFGVFDYLLKPFYAEQTIHRLKKFFEYLSSRNESKHNDISCNGKRQVLIISPNKSRWSEIINRNEKDFDFIVHNSATSGLEFFLKEFPEIVILDKNLPAISENIIAKKIKTTLSEKNNMNIELKCSIISVGAVNNSDNFDHIIIEPDELDNVLANIPN